MSNRIQRDHQMFRGVVSGATRKELQKHLSNGSIFRQRGDGGKIAIPIPYIDLPRFRFGKQTEGVGRGEGEEGDIVGKDPGKGQGGQGAGDGTSDGLLVDIDMKFILEALKQELELPNLKKKDNDTFDEVKIKYNGLSKVGPASLLHKRKTMLQCMKRMASMGKLHEKHLIPGYLEPVSVLCPITEDKRYRQWNEIKIQSSNAVIFFARDISGSMTSYKCDIVSDMAWWIDLWIKCFYEKVERCYVLHDTQAKEVDEKRFYKMRMGGGTLCSSAMKYIAKQLKHRYPPEKWNVYIFYFSDGDNMFGDNDAFCKIIQKDLPPEKVNLVGITQILPWNYNDTLKSAVDAKIASGYFDNSFVRTTAISNPEKAGGNQAHFGWSWDVSMAEEIRNMAIKNAIKDLLGNAKQKFTAAA